MKLLMVSANLPCPTWGASARNYHLLKALARQHTVSLLALTNSTDMDSFGDMSLLDGFVHTVHTVPSPDLHISRWQQLMSLVRGKSYFLSLFILKEMQDALDTLLTRDDYDVVLFESSLTAGYRLPIGMKTIIDEHNIEYELLERTYEQVKMPLRKWYNWLESRLLKQEEIERGRNADVVRVTSERERLEFKA